MLAATFGAWRDDSGGNDSGLKEAEIVFGKIKNFAKVINSSGCFEVDRSEADYGFVDDSAIGFDWWSRFFVAAM